MYRAFNSHNAMLFPINIVIRETRMKLEDAEWNNDPSAIYHSLKLQRLREDAARGILQTDPNF